MFKRQLIFTAATAITLLAFGGSAAASDFDEARYASEIKSCVARIADHANYDDATRVLHAVTAEKKSRLTYVFTIDTSVFTEADQDAIRKYASYCVARDNDYLVKFRIDEVSG